MRWKIAACLLPITFGLLFSFLLASGTLPDPIFRIRVDLAFLVFLSGLLASAAAFGYVRSQQRGRQIQRQIQEKSADERRRFLRRLDHELKNPLTAIRAGLANLAEAPSQAAQQEAIESVDAQALRLSRLSADLRKLAELETRPLEVSQVNLSQLIQEAFSLAQDNPGSQGRQLRLTLPQAPWPLPSVSGDHDLLFLALHNLLDNAIKFSRSGDTIEVRAFEDGSSIVLEVADTGPGIPGEDIQHVWEELYRGQSARGIPGSGLGLPLVRAIVERHGGQVTLRSRLSQGTVFSMRLPLR